MTLWNKQELLAALSDELLEHNLPDNLTLEEVVIDGRKASQKSLFIALHGEKHDAHDFLEQAGATGCRAFLVHNKDSLKKLSQPHYLPYYLPYYLLVKNTFTALYKLAAYSRQRSHAKILAITGSVGKTGVKEMLKLIFTTQGKTFANSGNLNNHIGLPLSLANFPADCAYGIFEMGMNHLGEIEPLSKLAKPHLALITNVGPAHIEFFKNEEEIALAKSEIFSGLCSDGFALINQDNRHFAFLKKRSEHYKIKDENLFSFGSQPSASYQLLPAKINDINSSEVTLISKNRSKISYEIASSNQVIIFNSIIAVACLDLLGNDLEKGLSALKNLQTESGRGKVSAAEIAGKKITIIDDSYNASLLSIHAGLEYAVNLKKILHKKRVVAALGDMLELGEKSVELHEEVTNYLQNLQIDFAILVGPSMTKASEKLSPNSYKTFPDSTAATLDIQGLVQDGDILYIKGSRGMKMEKLMEKFKI